LNQFDFPFKENIMAMLTGREAKPPTKESDLLSDGNEESDDA
jgi:hypothetical protein